MSPTKAQNRIRKQCGIGKGRLHTRMCRNSEALGHYAERAQWPGRWGEVFDEAVRQKMHELVDLLAADALIATAYREAEKKERAYRQFKERIDKHDSVASSI